MKALHQQELSQLHLTVFTISRVGTYFRNDRNIINKLAAQCLDEPGSVLDNIDRMDRVTYEWNMMAFELTHVRYMTNLSINTVKFESSYQFPTSVQVPLQ